MKETDLYEPVKKWLEAKGYKVFPEIELRGTRADVVGIKEGSSIIVELKTSLSRDLIDQGLRWRSRGSANLIYLASPKRTRPIPEDINDLLLKVGLGLITVHPDGCIEHIQSKSHLVNDKYDISKSITPLHEEIDIQGGHYGGGYLTGYKATIMMVQKFLESKGSQWVSIDDIIAACKTHYTGNVRSSLAKSLKEWEHGWCEHSVRKRRLHFRCKVVKK